MNEFCEGKGDRPYPSLVWRYPASVIGMAIAQYGSLRQQLPALQVATTTGNLTGSGTLYFSLQGRNRAGHNLPSAVVSATYSAGGAIALTIPATARAAGEDIFRFVISAGASNDVSTHQQLCIYEGYETDQETLNPLPVTITLSEDAHLIRGGIVADLANLPSGDNLLNGMLREVTAESKILRYEEDSTATVDNSTVYPASPDPGRWTVYGAFSTYQESTTDPGGCDRPASSVPLAALITPPTHPGDGSTGTFVNLWLISDRTEGVGVVNQGKRIGFNVYVGDVNKSALFDAQLKLSLNGFVRLSDGTLDTTGLTLGERDYRYGKAGAQLLEKDLPSGYAMSWGVAIALDQDEFQEPLSPDTPIRVEPFFYPQSGTPSGLANFLGNAIYAQGDRRRIVPDLGLTVKALSGAGIISGVDFPLEGERVIAGLAANTADQIAAINGDGAVTIEGSTGDLRSTQAIRAYLGTEAGQSEAGAWSAYTAVTVGQALTITLSHPTDGTNGTIRANYPDTKIAGNALGAFNPPLCKIYLQRQSDGEIREFAGLAVVDAATQDITISNWSNGVVVASVPTAPSTAFSLFAPGASSLAGSGNGTDFTAGDYRACFAYQYDGGQVTVIDHSSPPAVYEVEGDPSGWDSAATAIASHTSAADPHPDYALESSLSTVATTGAYSDLSGIPSTFSPSAHNHDADYEPIGTAASEVATHAAAPDPHPNYALESSLATVATSGAYADLTGTPAAIAPPSRRRHAYGLVKLTHVDANTITLDGMTGGSDLVFHSGANRHLKLFANTESITADLNVVWGTGNGARLDNSTTMAANQSYHVFIGYDPVGDTLKAGIVPNSGTYFNSNTLQPLNVVAGASGYLWLYVGSLRASGSGNLYSFEQQGEWFWFDFQLTIFSGSLTTTIANLPTFSPAGVSCLIDGYLQLNDEAQMYINGRLLANHTVTASSAFGFNAIGHHALFASNSLGQIAANTNKTRVSAIRQQGYKILV